MKISFFLLIISIFPNIVFSQFKSDCDNLGFVSGDMTGWKFLAGCHPYAMARGGMGGFGFCNGDGAANDYGCCPEVVNLNPRNDDPITNRNARHTLCSQGTDRYGNFPVVPPQLAGYQKSKYSLRLGNAVNGAEADRFERSFEVTKENAIFAYHFAFVLNDPNKANHFGEGPDGDPEHAQLPYYGLPFFEAKVLRGNGTNENDTLPCSSLLVLSNDTDFDSVKITGGMGGNEWVRYKSWLPVFLNLEKYIGETVTLRFSNADCGRGGHWGYSYVSVYCGPYVPMDDIILCVNDSATITSPFPIDGFELEWSTGDTTETITVIGDKDKTITLKVRNRTPIGEMATCEREYTVNIKVGDAPPPVLEDTIVCMGETATLYATPKGVKYEWYTEPTGGTPFHNGESYTTPPLDGKVTYYVQNPAKCASDERTKVTVDVIEVKAEATPESVICNGGSQMLNVEGGNAGTVYKWTPDDGTLSAVDIKNPVATPTVTTTYTVTVTDSEGRCPATDEVTITVGEIVADLDGTDVCIGFTTEFTNLTQPGNISNGTWLWEFGDGTNSNDVSPTHVYQAPGKYTVKLSAKIGSCEGEDTTTVEVYPNPIAAFTPTPRVTSADNPNITFLEECELAVRGDWNFGDGTTLPYEPGEDPVHTYYATNEGEGPFKYTIRLFVVSEHGCEAEVTDEIEIENIWTIYVPNSFTPNGDGINDFFKAYGIGILEFKMMVYNRWGEVVYRGNNMSDGWDGTPISGSNIKQDVYVWKIKAMNNRGKVLKLIGHVTLAQ